MDEKEKRGQPVKQAVALEYDPEEIAPKVIATGKGKLADKIVAEAAKSNVPIHQDEQLAKTLGKLDIGDAIPEELYEVVAEILVFVDAMDKIKGKMTS